LKPYSSTSWGTNQLASSLPSNYYIDFLNVPVNAYDAAVVYVGTYSTYYSYWSDFSVTAGITTQLSVADSGFTGSLLITNTSSSRSMTAIYLTPSSSSSWGVNQLTSNIGPSGSIHFYDMSPGSWDLWIVWDTGSDSVGYGYSIQSLNLLSLTAY
jgi:hypothetical protein